MNANDWLRRRGEGICLWETLEPRRLFSSAWLSIGGDDGGSAGGSDLHVTLARAHEFFRITEVAPIIWEPERTIDRVLFTFEADAPLSDYSATLSLGDGWQPMVPAELRPGANGTIEVIGTHTFAEGGVHSVLVNVQGPDGLHGGQLITIHTDAEPLNLHRPEYNYFVRGWGKIDTSVGSFFDVEEHDASEYTISIDWGDGTTSAGWTYRTSHGNWDLVGSHTYTRDGTFDIAVTISRARAAAAGGGTETLTIHSTAEVTAPPDGLPMPPIIQPIWPPDDDDDNHDADAVSDLAGNAGRIRAMTLPPKPSFDVAAPAARAGATAAGEFFRRELPIDREDDSLLE